jgi:hypothetical protein
VNQKFSTILDRSLVRRLKLESARRGKPMSELINEALESYLRPSKEAAREKGRVVDATWGSLSVDRETLKELMEEEESLLDS